MHYACVKRLISSDNLKTDVIHSVDKKTEYFLSIF